MALHCSSLVLREQLMRLAALCAMSVIGLLGCAPGGGSFSIIQLCVVDEAGIARFKTEMASIAAAEALPYRDASADALWGKEAGRFPMEHFATLKNVMWVQVNRSDGMGVGAGNMGLSDFDVALGFTEGSDPQAAREFAARVTQRLAGLWDIRTVPAGSGAHADPNCMRGATGGVQAPSNNRLERQRHE